MSTVPDFRPSPADLAGPRRLTAGFHDDTETVILSQAKLNQISCRSAAKSYRQARRDLLDDLADFLEANEANDDGVNAKDLYDWIDHAHAAT